jgi:hypothetical protein
MYDMVTEPAATPVTLPVVPTVALVASLLLHAPPVADSLSGIDELTQTLLLPVIADGTEFTVTLCVLEQPVPSE